MPRLSEPPRPTAWRWARRFAAAALLVPFGVAVARAACPVVTGPPPTAAANAITSIAQQLYTNCWTCQLYSSLFYGLRALVNTTYDTLVSGTLGGPALGITIVAITLLVRFLPFLVGSQDSIETIAGLRMFFFRVMIVFLGFLVSSSGAVTGSVSVMQANGIASNFFVDGPLALGTAVGESLSAVTSQALAASTGQPNVSLFGTYGTVPTGGTADLNGGSTSGSFAFEHVRAAQTILLNLHQMGVVGIVTGLWLGLEDPNMSINTPGPAVVVLSAALFMTWTFFMFTLTFGLKYIDALIRAMLIFSLTPFFLYLWIFDSTRSMAIQAMKSGLALAGVFAVSGIVFTVAYYILDLAYFTVFSRSAVGFTGLQALLCSLNATTVASVIGAGGQGATLNWMSYFYLVGSASMATACASLAFELAEQIFDFRDPGMGIGDMVSNDVSAGAQRLLSTVRRGI